VRVSLSQGWLSEREYAAQDVDAVQDVDVAPAAPSIPVCSICGGSHVGGQQPSGGGDLQQATTTSNIVESITRAGQSWVTDGVPGRPAVITYSFLDALPSGSTATQYPNFMAYTAQQRISARLAFVAWSRVSGATFVEVPASIGGMIQLGMHDFAPTRYAGYAGYASYPGVSPSYQGNAVLMMNRELYVADASMDPGSGGFQVLLHEIGHNLGLSHPHDGDIRLTSDLDHTQYTVMSYNWRNPFMTSPGQGDLLAVQALYGTDAAEQASGITWTLNRTTWTIAWTGSVGDDVLSGTNLSETLSGGAGADRINGGEGNDLIIPDAADLRLAGNEGTDTLDLTGFASAVNLDMNSSSGVSGYEGRLVVGAHTIALSTFENILGTAGNDTIAGTWWAAGTLTGGTGNDVITLRAGSSRAEGGLGNDSITGNGSSSTLVGGTGADTLVGWGSGSLLQGSDDNDTITGYGASSTLDGGTGNDTITGNGISSTLVGGAGADILVSWGSGSLLQGGEDNDSITGNGASSTLEGGTGADTLTGSASGLTLRGGIGDDTYNLVTGSGVTIIELAGEGTDTIILRSNTAHTLADNIENARGLSASYQLNVAGNALDNTLTGGIYVDTLSGGAGNDTLVGGGGFDRLTGGDGIDTAIMGFDTAALQIIRLNGELIVRSRTSTDTGAFLASVEQLRLSDGSTVLTSGLSQASTDVAYNWRTEWTAGQGLSDSVSVLSNFNRAGLLTFSGRTDYVEQLVLDDVGTSVTVLDMETVTGGAGADRVTLAGASNTIQLSNIESVTGSSGRDVVTLLSDATLRTVDGGPGYDVVVLAGRRASYTLTRSGNTVTVQSAQTTATLTNVERIGFLDAQELVSNPSWQTQTSSLAATNGSQSFTVRQQSTAEITDPTRGVLSSKVTVNGQDITGVPATLRRGWRVAAMADIDGNGKQEIFFFGMEQVQGVGSGFGATWELGANGAVEKAQTQFQMRIQGWEVAGVGNVNGLTGDEIIWQNVLTGAKAIWTDANRDGVVDGGFVIDGLGANAAERIVGLADLDKDSLQEFVLFNELTGRFSVYEATGVSTGNVTVALLQEFSSHTALTSFASQQSANLRLFDIFSA
jgi:Ca2+-binding RTX toxin-like protein